MMSRRIVAGVVIDTCDDCRVVWFDHGEIDPVLRSALADDSVSLDLWGPTRRGERQSICPRCLQRLETWSLNSAPRARMWVCERDGILAPYELTDEVRVALARLRHAERHDRRDTVERIGRLAWVLSGHIAWITWLIAIAGGGLQFLLW